MRELNKKELAQVSGAGSQDCCCPQPTTKKGKGNNGFGNGGNDGSNAGKQDVSR